VRTVLASLLVLPALALAQSFDPPAMQPIDAPAAAPGDVPAAQPVEAPASAAPARWSLGAGVSFGSYYLGGASPLPAYAPVGAAGVSYPILSTSVPAVVASVEHELANRAWLFFGVTASGTWNDYDTNAQPSSYSGSLRHAEGQSGSVELGVRGVVTPEGSPVTVSWLGSVEAGVAHAKGAIEFLATPSVYEQRYEARRLAANVGLAVERALGDRLAVRVATPLASVFYSDGEQRVESPGAGPVLTKAKSVGASFVVAPRLELRVFF
jgi:hypothetical protein